MNDNDKFAVSSEGQSGGITAGQVIVVQEDTTDRSPKLSSDASEYMHKLTSAYVEHGFPNHRGWGFDKGVDDVVHLELRAFGLIKQMGTRGSAWVLTDFGQRCVLANRSV